MEYLFGGSDDYFVPGLVFGDTWIMKNHVWGKVSDMGPPPSAIGSMVYTGTRVVLFGGVDILSGFNPSGDTWDKKDRLWVQRQNMGLPVGQVIQ
jgi:hypothetical protein